MKLRNRSRAMLMLGSAFVMGVCAAAANGREPLVSQAVIPASVEQVWDAFTTVKGIESWMVAHAEIDLRVGGEMRTNYQPNGHVGDEHTIINRILAFEPHRMLTIQNSHAPAGFPHADLFARAWTVIYFDSIAPDRTRMRIAGLGFEDGPDWDVLYNFFKAGNALTLEKLRQKFAPAPASAPGADSTADDPQRLLDLVNRLARGEWIHQGTRPDGKQFLVRNKSEAGPDGRSIMHMGWLGDENGMTPHAAGLVWNAPDSDGGGVWFTNVNEAGEIARGEIRLADHDTIEWDWNSTSRDGSTRDFRVTMRFEDDTHYFLRIVRLSTNAKPTVIVEARFEQVDKVPEQFLKMRKANQ